MDVKNDAKAIYQLGLYNFHGCQDIKKDIDKAAELFHRAAELGFVKAYRYLGDMNDEGIDVNKYKKKARQYYEKGAMEGCVGSRFLLAGHEYQSGNYGRAVKHWLIAASCGDIRSVNNIKEVTTMGDETKDQYVQAFRGYKEYLDEVKSEQRDKAATFGDGYKYLNEDDRFLFGSG